MTPPRLASPVALARVRGAAPGAIDFFERLRVFLALRRDGSRVPFFFRGDPRQFRRDGPIVIGRGVFVDQDAWFSVAAGGRLTIGDGTHINRGFVVTCAGRVTIGRHVMMADRVFIGDTNHGYEDISMPPLLQPMAPARPVTIEDDCWLGINSCVLAGVTVGRHAVVGANSVVTSDVPPYSVACGNPAIVIKQYDPTHARWERATRTGC